MPNIAISKKAHTELQKIKGEFMATNGKERSFDDVIMELVRQWRAAH
jgi:predicted CopG family antitoxin